MDLFVYSDESGVFDVVHNDLFVFGGLIMLGKEDKDNCEHMYAHAERVLRNNKKVGSSFELKATKLDNSEKSQLFRSLNGFYKFGVVIRQKKIHQQIFASKKTKQRYLDFAYKIALKRAIQNLIDHNRLSKESIDNIFIFVDEHTTATDGKYELHESIEQEFKFGTFNFDYQKFFDPFLPDMKGITLDYCDSASVRLIRASDIIANRLYYLAVSNHMQDLNQNNFHVVFLP